MRATGQWFLGIASVLVGLGLAGGVARADTVRVEVAGLRSDRGVVRAAVCAEDEFTAATCAHAASARADGTAVVVEDVPPGTWAVQVFHDEDGDGELDRRGFRPSEGMGFSRDARMRFGPPRFRDAAFALDGDATVRLTMRYFQ